MENRHDEKWIKVRMSSNVQLRPRAPKKENKKDSREPYREPRKVPLAGKAKTY
jgi:hypothetical protein